jgi:hypothetical protein
MNYDWKTYDLANDAWTEALTLVSLLKASAKRAEAVWLSQDSLGEFQDKLAGLIVEAEAEAARLKAKVNALEAEWPAAPSAVETLLNRPLAREGWEA